MRREGPSGAAGELALAARPVPVDLAGGVVVGDQQTLHVDGDRQAAYFLVLGQQLMPKDL